MGRRSLDDDDEIWLEIEDFPGYAVSNRGRVLNRKHDRVLKQHLNSYGFWRVNLWRDGRNYSKSIHILVARAFFPRLDPNRKIKHRDGDKSNNHVENLMVANGGYTPALRKTLAGVGRRKLLVSETGDVYHTIHDCAIALNISVRQIYRTLRGESITAGGYTIKWIIT